jgi:DnaJ-class molecular chaperone
MAAKPWLPTKPANKPRCKTCKGSGKGIRFQDWDYVQCNCPKCGGKGFIG